MPGPAAAAGPAKLVALGQTVRTILSLGNIEPSVSGTYSPPHNCLDVGLWGSGAFGTSGFPMGNIYAYVLLCPS